MSLRSHNNNIIDSDLLHSPHAMDFLVMTLNGSSISKAAARLCIVCLFILWNRSNVLVYPFPPSHLQKLTNALQLSRNTLLRQNVKMIQPLSTLYSGAKTDFDISLIQNATERHIKYMQMALNQARLAGEHDEVPIGAILVQRCPDGSFRVLSQARNSMEATHDASAHAEMLAMRQAAKRIGNWRLLNSTLYSTLEPCPMCLAAAQAFRVEEIVYGAPDLRLGAIETYMQMLEYQHPIHNIDSVVPGILKEESANMMKSFFRQRRTQTRRYPPKSPVTGRARWKNRMKSWLQKLNRLVKWN